MSQLCSVSNFTFLLLCPTAHSITKTGQRYLVHKQTAESRSPTDTTGPPKQSFLGLLQSFLGKTSSSLTSNPRVKKKKKKKSGLPLEAIKPSHAVSFLDFGTEGVTPSQSPKHASFLQTGILGPCALRCNLQQRGVWMQKSHIPSTFPWDFSNGELSLVWTKLNNTPFLHGSRPAQLAASLQASNHLCACSPVHPSQCGQKHSPALGSSRHALQTGIKVTALQVGVPASDAHIVVENDCKA